MSLNCLTGEKILLILADELNMNGDTISLVLK